MRSLMHPAPVTRGRYSPLTSSPSRRKRCSAPQADALQIAPLTLRKSSSRSVLGARPCPQSLARLRTLPELAETAVEVRTRAQGRQSQWHEASGTHTCSPPLSRPKLPATHGGWAGGRVDKAPASSERRKALRWTAVCLSAVVLLWSAPAMASAAQSGDFTWTVRVNARDDLAAALTRRRRERTRSSC